MRGFLSGEDPGLARSRRLFRRLPCSPHCKLCAAPFEGPGGAVLRHVGFGRFAGNPAICNLCIKSLNKIGVYGAEIPVSLLFADIRGSTGIGERFSPTEFRAFLDRFYRISSGVILDNDGLVDKFVGDEVIGLFFVGVSGQQHAAAAIRAARALLDGVARADATTRGAIPAARPSTPVTPSSARRERKARPYRLHCARPCREYDGTTGQRSGHRRALDRRRLPRTRPGSSPKRRPGGDHRPRQARARHDLLDHRRPRPSYDRPSLRDAESKRPAGPEGADRSIQNVWWAGTSAPDRLLGQVALHRGLAR